MGGFIRILIVLSICSVALALPIPKNLPIPKELQDTLQKGSGVSPMPVQQQKAQTTVSTDSCEDMVYNSPKASLVEQAGKDILKGMAVGAAAGALMSEDKTQGAVIGAMVGGAMAAAHKAATTKHLQREDYETTAKKLGYKPSDGNLLKVEIIAPDRELKLGNYAEFVLRVSMLTEDKTKPQLISVSVYLVSGNNRIPMGSEEYYMLPGTTSLVYQFPICKDIPSGLYILLFELVGVGKHAFVEGSFRVNK